MKRKQHQLDNEAGFAPLLLICAIAIIVFVGLGVYYVQKQASLGDIATPSVAPLKAASPSTMPSVTSIISIPLDLQPIAASLEPPPLFAGLDWQKQADGSVTESQLPIVSYQDKNTNRSKELKLKGKAWTYKKTAIQQTSQLTQIGHGLLEYYETALTKSGWSSSGVVAQDFGLIPINADGDGSSLWGSVGYKNGKIRVLSILWQTTYAKGTFPVDNACPCTQGVEVFVSDPLSPNDLATLAL